MIKKLLFTAALLMPCLAYGANPTADLQVQIVPPGAPPQVPAPAAAAGFTMLAINQNFDTSAFDQNPANWLDCKGAGSNSIWYLGWVGFGDGAGCNSISVGTDPVFGNQALRQQWTNANLGAKPSSSVMETANQSFTQGRLFTNYYMEVVGRDDNSEVAGSTAWWNLCSFGPTLVSPDVCVWEVDGMERYGTGVGGNTHNFTGNCPGNPGDCAWGVTFVNVNTTTQYRRWAWRVTAQLGQAVTVCMYMEDIPDVSGLNLLGCATGHPTGQDFMGLTTDRVNGNGMSQAAILLTGASPGIPGGFVNCPADPRSWNGHDCALTQNGGSLTTYIKRVRIYVCHAWTANQNPAGGANQCYTSSSNP